MRKLAMSRPLILLILFLPCSGQSQLLGQQEKVPSIRNAIYAEGFSLIAIRHISINYERMLTEHWSARVGYGFGGWGFDYDAAYGHGLLLMLMGFTGQQKDKFEWGGGLSVIDKFEYSHRRHSAVVHPALALGYRYQQEDGGFFFRGGLTWTYYYGFPFQVSFGKSL